MSLGFRRDKAERIAKIKRNAQSKLGHSKVAFSPRISIPWLGCSPAEPTSASKYKRKLMPQELLMKLSFPHL